MKKFLRLLCLPLLLSVVAVSCSEENDNLPGGDDPSGVTGEVIGEKLIGEWVCYYQYWEGDGYSPREGDVYYNNDDYGLTFYDEFTAYLKCEGNDGLLELAVSSGFQYETKDKYIIFDEETKWLITTLTSKELHLKWVDEEEGRMNIAKFVRKEKKTSLAGLVSSITTSVFDTTERYDFSYNYKGELVGIKCGGRSLTLGSTYNGKQRITWYDGKRLELADKRQENNKAEITDEGRTVVEADYDRNGYMTSATGETRTSVSGSRDTILYSYSDGNLAKMTVIDNYIRFRNEYDFSFEYSREENNANIDLNYFIGYIFASGSNDYGSCTSFELGMAGKPSRNLLSKVNTPEDVDIMYTYTYEKNAQGRISGIKRTCTDKWAGEILHTADIRVEYYAEED